MWARLKFWWAGVNLDKMVNDVQAMVTTSCNFVPMATSVAAVILAGNPAVVSAAATAAAICAAIKRARSTGSLLGDNPIEIVVDGVVIEGVFIK